MIAWPHILVRANLSCLPLDFGTICGPSAQYQGEALARPMIPVKRNENTVFRPARI